LFKESRQRFLFILRRRKRKGLSNFRILKEEKKMQKEKVKRYEKLSFLGEGQVSVPRYSFSKY